MKKFLKLQPSAYAFALMYLCTAVPLASAQEIPKVEEDNLAGKKVVLPDAAAGKVVVLALGFTRASKTPTRAWAQKIEAGLGKTPGFELYSLPVLESVPHMIRGMVISGMKHDIPESQRDHFVPVLHNETLWKTLVNYSEPDDAYLIVLDRSGKIAYQVHGGPNEQNYALLRQHVESLLK